MRRLVATAAAGATLLSVAVLSSAAASTPASTSAPSVPVSLRDRSLLGRLFPWFTPTQLAEASAARTRMAGSARPILDVLISRPAAATQLPSAAYHSWAEAALHLSLRRLDAAPPAAMAREAAIRHRITGRRLAGLPPGTPDPSRLGRDQVAPGTWLELRECESGDDYQADTGNGYYGAYQFSASSWFSIGFSGLPSQAPPPVQDAAARMLLARQGWDAWPACAARLGL